MSQPQYISSANTHDIKLVTNVVDDTVIRRRPSVHKSKTGPIRRRRQHLCLDKGYNSKQEEEELIKRGNMDYTYHTRKGKERKMMN